jgi:hypothetical protein
MMEPAFPLALAQDVGLAAGLILIGWLTASRIDPSESRLQSAALALPLGAGCLTAALFLASLLGLPLTRTLVLGTIAAAVLALSVDRLLWSRRNLARPSAEAAPSASASILLPALIMIGLVMASIALSIGRSFSTWDAAAIWGVKGYGIAREGSIRAAEEWGAYGLGYPLNVSLQISLFALLDGDVVPGSKLLFPLYYASLTMSIFQHWRLRRPGASAGWATIAIAALPVVFDHSTQAYANLPFTTYVVLGCLLAVRSVESGRRGTWLLSGLCLGLAAWTRPEGVLVAAVTFAALWLAARGDSGPVRISWAWVLPGLLLGGGWMAFVAVRGEMGLPPGAFANLGAGVLAGDLHLSSFYWIGRYLARDALNPSVWGVFLPILLAGGVLQLRGQRDGTRVADRMLFGAGLAIAGFVLAFYYLISFSGNLEWWLDTGLSRMLMPSAVLMGVWALSPWISYPEGRGASGGAVAKALS